jgi:hypothetical protein
MTCKLGRMLQAPCSYHAVTMLQSAHKGWRHHVKLQAGLGMAKRIVVVVVPHLQYRLRAACAEPAGAICAVLFATLGWESECGYTGLDALEGADRTPLTSPVGSQQLVISRRLRRMTQVRLGSGGAWAHECACIEDIYTIVRQYKHSSHIPLDTPGCRIWFG